MITRRSPRSDGQQLVASLAAIALASVLAGFHGDALALDGDLAAVTSSDLDLASNALGLSCRVCPDARVEFRELEAARAIDWKLALAAAMRAASRSRSGDAGQAFGRPGPDGNYVFANSPKEVALVIRRGLGPSSLAAHGADALAALANAAERTTQVPLDGFNFVTDAIVAKGRELGLRRMPEFHLRSKIENDRAGVSLSARW